MRVLLHPDGGSGIGLGHASRCGALAGILQVEGHAASVLVDPSSGLADYLYRMQVTVLEDFASPGELIGHAERLKANVVVIDSYRWSAADFAAIRQKTRLVAAFDDEAKRSLPVDAVINGAPRAERLAYRTLPHTRRWLGLQYQVIREEFRDVAARNKAYAVRSLIVLVGGSDPLGLLPQLAQRLDAIAARMQPSFKVQLICGPYTPMPATEALAFVEAVQHPSDLRERMLNADLALSASGQTLFELARCGTPTIAFCSGEDQVPNLAALADEGVVWDSGHASRPGWLDRVEAAIRILAAAPDRRDHMSSVAQSLIDGRGADRIVGELTRLVADQMDFK